MSRIWQVAGKEILLMVYDNTQGRDVEYSNQGMSK
jgi:hypothetical protein